MFTEDLDAFLDEADFAVAATLQGGATGAVKAIFDAAYLEALGVSGTGPTALVKAAAVVAADVGKTLTIGAVAYTIRNREPQDDGAFVLLRLQAP